MHLGARWTSVQYLMSAGGCAIAEALDAPPLMLNREDSHRSHRRPVRRFIAAQGPMCTCWRNRASRPGRPGLAPGRIRGSVTIGYTAWLPFPGAAYCDGIGRGALPLLASCRRCATSEFERSACWTSSGGHRRRRAGSYSSQSRVIGRRRTAGQRCCIGGDAQPPGATRRSDRRP